MKLLFFIFITYLLGSLPSGVWIGRLTKNIDIRDYGSKNSGATNAYRILGAKYGTIVLVVDVLKGMIALLLAKFSGFSGNTLAFLALVAILGHTFSCFLSFRGGKGVATSFGVFLVLEPKIAILLLLVFLGIVFLTRYISLGSIIVAFLLPVLTVLAEIQKEESNVLLILITILLGVFVIYRHKSNINRLLSGTENKFKL